MKYVCILLAICCFVIGLGFIYAWRRWPSADPDKPSEYLRRGDRNAMLGVVGVFWACTISLGVLAAVVTP